MSLLIEIVIGLVVAWAIWAVITVLAGFLGATIVGVLHIVLIVAVIVWALKLVAGLFKNISPVPKRG